MYRVADAIARATSLDELLDEAIDTLLEATGADRAAVLLRDQAGVMRFCASRGLSNEYRAHTEGHSPWAENEDDPQPVLIADVASAGFDAELEHAIHSEGIAALAFIPLVHGDRLLGKFMLYHDQPHAWSDDEVRLSRTIANHLASATVHTQAQEALRASSEQLSTVMRTVDEGIVVQSQTGGLVYANDAAARFVGFSTTAEFLAASRTEVLAQFEILDEQRRPRPRHRRGALVGRAREPRLRRHRRSHAVGQRDPRHHGEEID
jgi:GAF domain-containing protein